MRGLSELQDHVQDELGWRKRELTTQKFMVQQARKHELPVLLRSGVCIIYAHWEGFAKSVALAYIDFISRKGLCIDELADHLVAAALRSEIRSCGESKKPTLHTDLVLRLRNDLHHPAKLVPDKLVDTESNLNSDVLKEMLCLLGVDPRPFEGKAVMLDEKLLKNRNTIAHGNYLLVDLDDYNLMHGEIISMMNEFGDRILTAALTKVYKAA